MPCLLACLEEQPSSTSMAASLIGLRYLTSGTFSCAFSVVDCSIFLSVTGHTHRLTERLGRSITAVASVNEFQEFQQEFKEPSKMSKGYKEISEKFQEWRKGPGKMITLSFDDSFK